jgi:glutamate/tyrosine decarboxylase-like PLP-dependent enzyme
MSDPTRMHTFGPDAERLAEAVVAYALERVRMEPTLDGPRPLAELTAAAGASITPDGIGGHEALRRWVEVLAPACISQDHPRALSFVPSAPTEAAVLFDLVVGASSIYAGSWLEGAGAVYAENEALRWVADLAGLPGGAGGCFVAGGSAGNLSALVAARHTAARRRAAGGRDRSARWWVACSAEAHSSVAAAARVMDVEVLDVPTDERGRLTGPALAATLEAAGEAAEDVFAVVATAGTTNAGMVDDLAGVAEVCERHGLWLHVDAAYGGAGLAAPSVRAHFDGIERADSLVVDPHKWLFAPFDCAALVYREPELARAAHTQSAAYLEVLAEPGPANEWNPSDYAHHLSRRARGLPFWFSLATWGTDAYRDAVERTLEVARGAAEVIRARPGLELVMDPVLSVVMFRRLGWERDDYRAWSDRMLAEQRSLTVPSSWRGEPVMRFCIVNPRTTVADLTELLDTMT